MLVAHYLYRKNVGCVQKLIEPAILTYEEKKGTEEFCVELLEAVEATMENPSVPFSHQSLFINSISRNRTSYLAAYR